MTQNRICVITATRAEYGLLRWVMQDIFDNAELILQTIVTGAHLSSSYGMTIDEIERDGFTIDARISFELSDTSPGALSVEVGKLVQRLVPELLRLKPNMVVVLGDRYELLGVATACTLLTIPMAHIAGGESTEGAIDEQIRHAMTKMSHLHFVANETYGKRVRQLGEEPWRICVSGEPGLDNLYRETVMSCEELSENLGLDLSLPTALVTYHSVTLEQSSLDKQMMALTAAMNDAQDRHGLQYIITHPGADAGSKRIIEIWEDFVGLGNGRQLVPSLGQKRYFSALRYTSLMLGNSSSGIIETPSFNLPTVNIGNRQGGRMRALNVIEVGYDQNSIIEGIDQALKYDRSQPCENPYGDGQSSQRIVKFIQQRLQTKGKEAMLLKKFVDM